MNLRYNQQHKRILLFLMTGLLFACFVFALCLGSVKSSPFEVFSALNPFSGLENTTNNNLSLIVEKIRLPRVLLAILIGATLAVCGTVAQGLFRNPLADPSLIGVSAGASIGATTVIVLGSFISSALGTTNNFESSLGLSAVSFGAFITALISTLIVYKLATQKSGTSVTTMLLAGIAITAMAGGLTSLMEYISDYEALRRISLWRMGGLDGANLIHVSIMSLVLGLSLVVFFKHRTALNALLLGESEARHLGVNVQRTKLLFIIFIAASVGVAVSIAGGIGFIGLIVPHIMRLIIGPNHHHLLPATIIAGALLLLIADTLARTIISPAEIPVGIITALIGAPFFISLLRNRHNYGMQDS